MMHHHSTQSYDHPKINNYSYETKALVQGVRYDKEHTMRDWFAVLWLILIYVSATHLAWSCLFTIVLNNELTIIILFC